MPAPTSPVLETIEPNVPYRVEETAREGCAARRRYNLRTGPEWLKALFETEASKLFRRRTWYYPWGPVCW